MLTVKVRLPNGNEYIKEVASVWMDVNDNIKHVYFYQPLGMPLGDRIEEGDIFVMNENGKTIADYHLHCPIPPSMSVGNLIHGGSNGNPIFEPFTKEQERQLARAVKEDSKIIFTRTKTPPPPPPDKR